MMNIRHLCSGIILSFFFIQGIYSQSLTSAEITASDLKTHISYLASDDLGGRYTGSTGSYKASEYIREQFRKAGLRLLGADGYQEFEVVVSVSAGENNVFKINDKVFTPGVDFTPFPFSKNATLISDVVFAGYVRAWGYGSSFAGNNPF